MRRSRRQRCTGALHELDLRRAWHVLRGSREGKKRVCRWILLLLSLSLSLLLPLACPATNRHIQNTHTHPHIFNSCVCIIHIYIAYITSLKSKNSFFFVA